VQSVRPLQELDRVHLRQVHVGRDDSDIAAVLGQMFQCLQPLGGGAGGHHPVVGAEAANQRGSENLTSRQITISDKQDRSMRRHYVAGSVRGVHLLLLLSRSALTARLLPGVRLFLLILKEPLLVALRPG
jgi:hypothetical protein